MVRISKRLGLFEFLDKVSIGLVEGNMYYSNQDFRIPGRVPVRFNRQYNSQTEKVGPMGMGWSHEYYRKLKINSDYIIYATELLQEVHFRKSAEGNWYSSAHKDLILKEIPEGYSLVVIPGQAYIFDKAGELTAISYRDGSRLRLEHAGGVLRKIITMSGKTLDISYNTLGLIEAVSSQAEGEIRRVAYEYDSYTNLVSVTDPMGNVTQYQYFNNNIIKITDAEKREVNFIYNSSDRIVKAWAEKEANLKTFLYNTDKMYSAVVDGNGAKTELYYNRRGLVEKERRPDGAEYDFMWDEDGRLIQITCPDKRSIYLAYDRSGNLISETDADGGRTKFEYNEQRQVTLFSDPNNQSAKYMYNNYGTLVQVVEPGTRITRFKSSSDCKTMEVINPKGGKRIFQYDDDGNTTAIIDEMGYVIKCEYDQWGWLKRIVNPDGGITEMLLDKNNQEIKMIQPDNSSMEYLRDRTGYIKEIIRQGGAKTQFSYDILGRCTAITDSLGKSSIYAYDQANNLVKVVDVMGYEKEIKYDLGGRPITVKNPDGGIEHMTYDSTGNLYRYTDSKGGITSFEYNGKGQVTKIVDPLGYIRELQYDYKGQLVRSVNEAGNQTYYRYSAEGYLLETGYPDGSTTSNGYDLNGNMIFLTDQEGKRVEFEYDALDRPIAVKNTEGGIRRLAYDGMGRLILMADESGNEKQFEYDRMGRRVSETDAMGNKWSYEYDGRGNLIKETDFAGAVFTYKYDLLDRVILATDPLGGEWSLGYDAFGNVTEITNPQGHKTMNQYDLKKRSIKNVSPAENITEVYFDTFGNIEKSVDPMGNIVEVNYDPLGRVTGIIRKALDSNGQEYVIKEVSEYDPVGSLRKVTDGMGNTTEFVYDRMQRIIKTINALGKEETYSYNRKGEMISRKDYNGQETLYTYDPQGMLKSLVLPGNLTEEYSYAPNGLLTSVKTNDFEEQYSYDKLNRLTTKKTRMPFAVEIKYQYDDMKKVLTVKDSLGAEQKHEYDLLGRLKTILDPFGGRWEFAHTPSGLRESLVYPNKMICRYTYDEEGRLVKKTASKDESIIESFEYSYDRNSRITSEKASGYRNTYKYDALGQMVKTVTVENGSESENVRSFEYDKAGNLLLKKENDKICNYLYDKDNRLLNAGSVRYSYDENGNTISMEGEAGSAVYRYDAQNRLTAVDKNNGENVLFGYSPLGSRILKSVFVNGIETRHHYLQDGTNVLREANAGKEEAYNLYGPVMDELLAVNTPQGMNLIISDIRGSICKITDRQGKVLEAGSYGPFGERTQKSAVTPFSYTGREYDPETSFNYYRARYYDSRIGRFINKDPIGLQAGLNQYAYCYNDPVNNIDPDGTYFWFLAGSAATSLLSLGIDYLVAYCRSKAESIRDYSRSGEYSFGRAAITVATGMLSAGVGGLIARSSMGTAGMLFTSIVSDTIVSTGQEAAISELENKEFNFREIFIENFIMTAIGYALFRPRISRAVMEAEESRWLQRFSSQGYSRNEVQDLVKPYYEELPGRRGLSFRNRVERQLGIFFGNVETTRREGQHFIPKAAFRRLFNIFGEDSIPGRYIKQYRDSMFNVVIGRGMNKGQFYEFHAPFHLNGSLVPWGRASVFKQTLPGRGHWSSDRVSPELKPYGLIKYLWYGSPTELKVAVLGIGYTILGPIIYEYALKAKE